MVNLKYNDFGVIEDFLRNSEIADIRILSENEIYYKKVNGTRIHPVISFADNKEYEDLIQKIVETNPVQNIIVTNYVRLPDMLLKIVYISGNVCSEGVPCLYIRKLKNIL